jgi:sugar phosphate isomerase/epimerase
MNQPKTSHKKGMRDILMKRMKNGRVLHVLRAFFLPLLPAVLLSVGWAAQLAEPPPLRVGCQTYTFNRYTVYEAVEKTAEAGGTVVELYPGQRLSAADPKGFGPQLSDDQITGLREHLKKHGVTAASVYTAIPKDEGQARKLFVFAKRLGLEALTTESADAIETIEKMVQEFDLRVGFHGHRRNPANENYRLWDPQFVLDLVKHRDARIGVCADTGHWASSGVVPLEAIQLLGGRILNLHLKDRPSIGSPTTDQIFGKGVLNVAGILQELRRQKFNGCVFIEYETNWTSSVPDVRQCVDFIRSLGPQPAATETAGAPVQ